MTKCEGCEEKKDVTEIEGHLLCKDCKEDIIRCSSCNRFLAIDFDELEIDNFGRLSVPELSLPDKQTRLIFCNIDCLEGYLQKYKKEHKEYGKGVINMTEFPYHKMYKEYETSNPLVARSILISKEYQEEEREMKNRQKHTV